MKKIVSLALVVIMMMMMCSFAAADEQKVLTFWVPQYQFSKDENAISDKDFWDREFDAFEAENNCVVNVEILPWSDYNTTIYTGLLNNDGPDVVYVTDSYDLVTNDMLLPLDGYLTEEEKDNYILWDGAAKNAADEHCNIVMNGGASPMFYNKDILAEAGIEAVPETWEDFLAACVTIKEKTDKQAFIQNWGATTGTSALMNAFWPYYFQAGGVVLNDQGEVDINNEAGLATLEFLNSFATAGIFDDTIVAETGAKDKFVDGTLAFYVEGDTTGMKSANGAEINYGIMFSLKGASGYGTRAAGDSFAVNARTVERGTDALAAKLLVYATSAKVMDAWHQEVYSFPSVTKDATAVYNPMLDTMYAEHITEMHIVPEFEGKASFEDQLQANIQLMFMGDLTPQEVLDETMTYYVDQIKQ